MTPFLIEFLLGLFLFGPPHASPRLSEGLTTRFPTTFFAHVVPDVRADTVKSGQTFITNLPDSVSGQSVVRYRGIELPARSWLMKRSFFWKTSTSDRGEHEFWFRAYLNDETVDSLSVHIIVE